MGTRKNPATSLEAYKVLQPEQLRQTYKDILFALSQLGEATTEQIADALKVKPDKIWRRVSEMLRMELIYRPGNKRLLKSGKNGYTWVKTTSGESTKIVIEKALPGATISDFSKKILQPTLF